MNDFLSISAGNIIDVLIFLGSCATVIFRIEGKLGIVTATQTSFMSRLDRVDEELRELAKVTIEMARQTERLNSYDARITTLESSQIKAIEFKPPRRKKD